MRLIHRKQFTGHLTQSIPFMCHSKQSNKLFNDWGLSVDLSISHTKIHSLSFPLHLVLGFFVLFCFTLFAFQFLSYANLMSAHVYEDVYGYYIVNGRTFHIFYKEHKQKIWYVTIVNNKDNINVVDGLIAIP